MKTRYFVVANVRKSDRCVFFPEGRLGQRKLFETVTEALEEARRKAVNNSGDYYYVVFSMEGVVSVERKEPPVGETWL